MQSENTFLLALDGDVDFKPEALQLLVDRLKKNRKVGVVCGRIHPIGSGKNTTEYAVTWIAVELYYIRITETHNFLSCNCDWQVSVFFHKAIIEYKSTM